MLTLAVAVASLGGCSFPAPSTDNRSSVSVYLPTLPGLDGPAKPCAGVGLEDSVVHGMATAPDPVWLDTGRQARRTSVRWPAGFSARFAPQLEIIDTSGAVVAKEGDTLSNIGGSLGQDGRFDIWEFNGTHYPCS